MSLLPQRRDARLRGAGGDRGSLPAPRYSASGTKRVDRICTLRIDRPENLD